MQQFLQYLCAWVTAIAALSPTERLALIPTSLRRKLCERSGRPDICNFREERNTIDDEDYSKWSICKYHPELLFCKWDPSVNSNIPQAYYEERTSAAPLNSIDEPFVAEPDFMVNGMDMGNVALPTPKTLPAPNVVQPQFKEVRMPSPKISQSFKAGNTVKVDKSRYDGNLNVDLRSERTKSKDSPEDEEFDENIMVMKGDIFE